jgi:hypothetical protein
MPFVSHSIEVLAAEDQPIKCKSAVLWSVKDRISYRNDNNSQAANVRVTGMPVRKIALAGVK